MYNHSFENVVKKFNEIVTQNKEWANILKKSLKSFWRWLPKLHPWYALHRTEGHSDGMKYDLDRFLKIINIETSRI